VTGSITVRVARDDELDEAGAIVAEAYRVMPGMGDDVDYLAFVRDARGRTSDCDVLVAVDEAGRVLGSASYVSDPASGLREIELPGEAAFRMLGVSAAARGRGAGQALVVACIDRARASGRTALAISTMPGWADAHRLYERLGFRRAPERDFDPGAGVHLIAFVLPL